ncbi:hypothetical protein AIOL_000625 [Candidatus Rhodobacter oscarellae]|uniref:Uncharacterized protein n=2 Tax=Candidatus Rhodobacter oscarellae TaxID=1675527 RepID=A0A0J9EFL1_9RHOB|nr:hypothetical protein AIOL_000625 [Candidatus Rhodobacter lobularis]
MVVLLLGMSPTDATSKTPNHVFQITEKILIHLTEINERNFSQTNFNPAEKIPALPRHVYFLAREQWRKVQLLRFMNGLDTSSLPGITISEITPGDVLSVTEALLQDIRELGPAYGLADHAASAPLPSGKKPADVYENLLRISAQLDALGIPATVPNDVYRVADTLLSSMERVTSEAGVRVNIDDVAESNGRSPSDVYNAVRDLSEALERVTKENASLAIKNGVLEIPAKNEAVTPSDVIVALNLVLADTVSLMAVQKTSDTLEMASYSGGKTPSDVYRLVRQSHLLIDSMGSGTPSSF